MPRKSATAIAVKPSILSDADVRALVGEPLLTTEHVALKLSCSVSRLNKQRLEGKGPAFVKDGANIRYRPIDVEVYIAERLHTSTSEVSSLTA